MKEQFYKFLMLMLVSAWVTVENSQAQAPTISGFTPSSDTVGATVTITGTNFNTTASNNVVIFGATVAQVSQASSTSLTVTVPAGATYGSITEINTGTNLSVASLSFF